MIGYGQLLIIVFVVILLFGGAKIPELMRGMGRGVREFNGCCVNLLKKDGLSNKPSPSPPVGNPLAGISSGVSVPPCFIGNPAYGGIMRQ